MADFSLTIIGSGSALPMHGRHPSAQVVEYEHKFYLIDCGEGTQERLKDAGIKAFRIGMVLISHLHGDHIFGLPGLLGSMAHLKRTAPLTIYGPAGLKGLLTEIITYTELKITYPLKLVELTPKGLTRIIIDGNLEILTFPLYHRIACNGYLLKEWSTPLKFNKSLIQDHKLTAEQIQALKSGEEILIMGRKMAREEFIQAPSKAVSYAYCSDTRYDRRLLSWIKGVSVLYHETTFMKEKEEMAEETGHSTTEGAGRMAKDSGASCLITGHYSSRYKHIDKLIEEARQYFGYVLAAEEGKKYNLRSLADGANRES